MDMIPWNHQQNSEINGEFPTMETPNYGNDYSVSLPQTLVSNGYPPKMSTDASQFYGYTDSFASFPSPPFPLTEFQSDTYCRTSSFQPASNPSAPTASYQSLNNRQYYCQICRISVSGPEPFNQHIAGKKHQFKISATQENSQFSWDCFKSSNRSELAPVPYDPRTDSGLQFAEQLLAKLGPNAFIPEQLLYCTPCQLQLPSLSLYRNHLYSATHLAAVDRTLLPKGQRAELVGARAPATPASERQTKTPQKTPQKAPELGASTPSRPYILEKPQPHFESVSARPLFRRDAPHSSEFHSSVSSSNVVNSRWEQPQGSLAYQKETATSMSTAVSTTTTSARSAFGALPPPPPLPSALKMLVRRTPPAPALASLALLKPPPASLPVSVSDSISTSSSCALTTTSTSARGGPNQSSCELRTDPLTTKLETNSSASSSSSSGNGDQQMPCAPPSGQSGDKSGSGGACARGEATAATDKASAPAPARAPAATAIEAASGEARAESELIARVVHETPKPEHVFPQPIPSRYVFAAGPILQGLFHHIAEVESNAELRVTLERHRAPPSPKPKPEKRPGSSGARGWKRGRGSLRALGRGRGRGRGRPGLPRARGRGSGRGGGFGHFATPYEESDSGFDTRNETFERGRPTRGRGARGRWPSQRLQRGGFGGDFAQRASAFAFGGEGPVEANAEFQFGPEQAYFTSFHESGSADGCIYEQYPYEYEQPAEYNPCNYEYSGSGGGMPETSGGYEFYPDCTPSQYDSCVYPYDSTCAHPNDGLPYTAAGATAFEEQSSQYPSAGMNNEVDYMPQQYFEPPLHRNDCAAATYSEQPAPERDSDWRAPVHVPEKRYEQYEYSYSNSSVNIPPTSANSRLQDASAASATSTSSTATFEPTPATAFQSAPAPAPPPPPSELNFFMQAALRATTATVAAQPPTPSAGPLTAHTAHAVQPAVQVHTVSSVPTPQPVPPPRPLAASRPPGLEWAPPPPPPFNYPPPPPPPSYY